MSETIQKGVNQNVISYKAHYGRRFTDKYCFLIHIQNKYCFYRSYRTIVNQKRFQLSNPNASWWRGYKTLFLENYQLDESSKSYSRGGTTQEKQKMNRQKKKILMLLKSLGVSDPKAQSPRPKLQPHQSSPTSHKFSYWTHQNQ